MPVLAAARAAGRLGLQIECDGQRPDRARLVGLGLAAPGAPPLYVPIAHRYLSAPRQLPVAELPAELAAVLADPAVAVYVHDGKTARRALRRAGLPALEGVRLDAMLASYLIDEALPVEQVVALAGVALPARTDLLGKGKTAIDFESVAVEQAAMLAGGAAAALLPAGDTLLATLDRAADLRALHDTMEVPLARLLADIEDRGIRVDLAHLRALGERVAADVAALEKQIYELAGGDFNLGSTKQLQSVLFDKLGLASERMRKTKTGFSTDADVLESLVDVHPIIQPILDHRELVKLEGTYIKALPPLVNPATGRVHTSFDQAVATTGRLSSRDPNLQNIPIRSAVGRDIRRAFVAEAGKVLLSADYSQIELRIIAHMSGDPVLQRAFREDIDVHTQTAAEVFGIPLEEVGAHERRVAKAVNYGLAYGQSDFGLGRALDLPRAEARRYIDIYFERFSRVRQFMDELRTRARRDRYAVTLLGRRRPIPDIDNRNVQRRNAAERIALNAPVQGTGADIMKLAMLRCDELLAKERFPAAILLTVHDELVFEVAADHAEAVGAAVKSTMEQVFPLSVPLRVDLGIAPSWADAHG
jgi:DNA polymerase-1